MLVKAVSFSNQFTPLSFQGNHSVKITPNTFERAPQNSVKRGAKVLLPFAILALLVGLGMSCKTATGSSTDDDTTTETPATPTKPTDPAKPTQSAVQTALINFAKILGISTSTNDITGFGYTDNNSLTSNTLSLNTNDTTSSELVYDGTSVDQIQGTTSYIRNKITKTSDDGVIIKKYNTIDGNAASETNPWINCENYKYILAPNGTDLLKYSLNLDDTKNVLVAKISPESDSSLLVTTPDDLQYELTDIAVTTK